MLFDDTIQRKQININIHKKFVSQLIESLIVVYFNKLITRKHITQYSKINKKKHITRDLLQND